MNWLQKEFQETESVLWQEISQGRKELEYKSSELEKRDSEL